VSDPLAAPLSPRASTWNIANALTVLRLVLVPLFVLALFEAGGHETGWRLVAFGVFFLASYTDRVDGQLARSRNLITPFGKLADPLADKALMGAALIGLSVLDELPWWITVVVMAREIGVTLLRFWVIRHGVIPASRGGKVKTLLQGLAIGFYVLPLSGVWASGRAWLMGLAVVVTVVTGVDYVTRAVTLRRTSERAAMKRARKAARQS
jgi:CDP-diacylglycerol--glycerol-3-phosphate 3-phosphatidyltransferase